MTALEFIKLKQIVWAEKYIKKLNENNENKIHLVSGTLINGKEANNSQEYFEEIKYNLFPIKDDKNINEYGLRKINNVAYSKGSGNEIIDKIEKKEENKTKTTRAKMKAVFSSSAIVVNLFQYWQNNNNDISHLLKALRIIGKHNNKTKNATIKFEVKKEITNPDTSETISTPNLDITIEGGNLQHIIAIESKFTEPYSHKTQKELAEKYNNDELWKGLEEIKEEIDKLEKEKREKIFKFKRLDYLQLTKHILGLKTQHGKKFKLLYLWYDVPGTEGCEHRKEIEEFKELLKDKIDFRSITYQEVIYYLRKNYYNEHKEYIDYLVERYL